MFLDFLFEIYALNIGRLYLFRHKEGQVRHVPKENLECSLAS